MDGLVDVVTWSLMLVVYLVIGGVVLLVLFWSVVGAVVLAGSLWKRRRKRPVTTD
jgi:hypothetical protein